MRKAAAETYLQDPRVTYLSPRSPSPLTVPLPRPPSSPALSDCDTDLGGMIEAAWGPLLPLYTLTPCDHSGSKRVGPKLMSRYQTEILQGTGSVPSIVETDGADRANENGDASSPQTSSTT
jgi:hypothetical protein